MAGNRGEPWRSWTAADWRAYRARQEEAGRRPGNERWAVETLPKLVAAANYYITHLDPAART